MNANLADELRMMLWLTVHVALKIRAAIPALFQPG
jgi:hypothetical protein